MRPRHRGQERYSIAASWPLQLSLEYREMVLAADLWSLPSSLLLGWFTRIARGISKAKNKHRELVVTKQAKNDYSLNMYDKQGRNFLQQNSSFFAEIFLHVDYSRSSAAITISSVKSNSTRCGDRTHDHTIKSRALFRLS
jgi:hypothetical protein